MRFAKITAALLGWLLVTPAAVSAVRVPSLQDFCEVGRRPGSKCAYFHYVSSWDEAGLRRHRAEISIWPNTKALYREFCSEVWREEFKLGGNTRCWYDAERRSWLVDTSRPHGGYGWHYWKMSVRFAMMRIFPGYRRRRWLNNDEWEAHVNDPDREEPPKGDWSKSWFG